MTELDDGGLPVHLPMGVTAQGQGPTEPETPHHRVCWCLQPGCRWSEALALERLESASQLSTLVSTALTVLAHDALNSSYRDRGEAASDSLLRVAQGLVQLRDSLGPQKEQGMILNEGDDS